MQELKVIETLACVKMIDELGRIAIPKEIRKKIECEAYQPFEIYVQEDKIILQKYIPN